MVIASICIWFSIAFVVYKIRNIGRLGQLIRYSVQIILFLVVVLIVRLIFFIRSSEILADIFVPNLEDFYKGLSFLPNYGLLAFGSGCGLILTLASFNKFNTNIRQTSWWIGIGHFVTIVLFSILELLIRGHISSKELYDEYYMHRSVDYLSLYLMGGSVFAEMPWPNFWSILFYFMLTLAGCTLMIIQITVILKSIFDEFISLRRYETRISLAITAAVALVSLLLSSMRGHENLLYLRGDSLITQSLIDLLVILAVFTVANVFNAQGLLITLFHVYRLPTVVYSFMFRPLPWLCVPVYAVHCLWKSRRSFKTRLIRSCRPTDWHPVQLEDLQRYESLLNTNTTDMTHPLNVLEDDENA
ncbi:hypothetical protein DOY81_011335 [Sarcophaga bullata]|nr:hypothetical protein DOY81_011335 [Sarcophaga bullata]